MLTIFPEILFLSPLAPFLIRIALAVLFGSVSWSHVQRLDALVRTLAVLEAAIAVLLAVGAWTQPAALVASAIVVLWLALPNMRATAVSTALLALIMALSLVVTGAGAFAFDLPL
ncbi:hypothetical protein A2853_03325 [Candidatus Kaiserbacteria bacterium RIFCSPHIGHO2_01_FULL_55_17]|uniref:DoxX family protein n=1 Tax=Candidatus Kaiserbacteria bacterium RIFCSPHIGHO2_01_FULL_55_17 TaxID=1798484 RepID=A0A1F6DA81_9BACT|nr:MAG: hypothetical protein A2853_03325 [Candidatus Kaiserbacteria bacterium RIFCSPHIGHO2_01_FULL_55_17]